MKQDNKKGLWVAAAIFAGVCLIASQYQRITEQRRQEWEAAQEEQAKREMEAVLASLTRSEEPETKTETEVQEETETESETETTLIMLPEYEVFYERNPEIVGWLTIEDTPIDYPVLQNEDSNYYLHRDFDGNEDKYGSLFVKAIADINTPGTNIVIYGHHMRDGSMFGSLKKYLDEEYLETHRYITFNTLYERRTYEVVSVFRSQVYEPEQNVFKYYDFYQANNEAEFDYFYDHIKELSVYDIPTQAEYGDTFITLSTCAYHVENGRLVVVAKRIA